MIENLGVMQGRLLPKYQGRYQAHPVGYWQDEFKIAQELGLSFIEFIFDYDRAEKNPLMQQSGLKEIRKISEQTGVRVRTICADYLMEAPLHSVNDEIAATSNRILQTLIKNASQLGVTDIVIPCVDRSALKSEPEMLRFIKNISSARDIAEKLQINLALETDLPPQLVVSFLETLASKIFTVNYDTGNSAAAGYDPAVELAVYGDRISDIHLKDRLRGGNSVELGQGDADFQKFFAALAQTKYTGPLILQAYRDNEGVQIFQKQLAWLLPQIEDWARYRVICANIKDDAE
jgi:L-ribulose-5-phosphate 3-epimerase UlaE